MRFVKVLIWPSECPIHESWLIHSDSPWHMTQSDSVEKAIEDYLIGIKFITQISLDHLWDLCHPNEVRAPIFDLPTTEHLCDRTVNWVGLAHTTFQFYIDQRNLKNEFCKCTRLDDLLERLKSNGVEVEPYDPDLKLD